MVLLNFKRFKNVSMFSSVIKTAFWKWLVCAFNLLPRANCDRIKQILLFCFSAIFRKKDITRGRLRLFARDTLIKKLLSSSSFWLWIHLCFCCPCCPCWSNKNVAVDRSISNIVLAKFRFRCRNEISDEIVLIEFVSLQQQFVFICPWIL